MLGGHREVLSRFPGRIRLMKKEAKRAQPQGPSFDESILEPVGDEVVRAVHTLPNQEFAFERYCRTQGVIVYLPLQRTYKVHNFIQKGRPYSYSSEVFRPMFTSYAFVKMALPLLRTLHDSHVVAQILPLEYGQDKFLDEIRVVRTCEMLGLEQELEVHRDILEGRRFRIMSGVWNGVVGRLTRKDDVFKWTVEIEILSQFVTTIIDPTQFKLIPLDE